MTDSTQPEAREFTMSQYASKDDMIGAMRKRIAELEAQIEALSGVQALSAAPEAIAKLRHLYQNMVNGAVRDTASAKRIADGLLAPAIEALERATPPAEQQAAPKAAPGDAIDEAMLRERDDAEDFIDALLDEVLGHERPEWSNLYGRADALNDVQERMTALHKPAVDKAWGQFQSAMAAPQQEVQEPVAWLNPWRADKVTTDYDAYGKHGIPLYTAPQPVAREPLTDEQLAEMMRDTWGCASIAPRHALQFARSVERAHGITQKGCD